MKRIVDDPQSLGARLVRSAAITAPMGRKERVWAKLAAPVAIPFWRTPSGMAVGAIAIGATLAAGLAMRAPTELPPVLASAPRAAPVLPTVAAPVVAPPVAQATVAEAPTLPLGKAIHRHVAAPDVATLAPLVTPPSPVTPAPEEAAPSELVFGAARALHRDHDPARALGLLADYQRREPDGDLAQECLALVVEAKVALDDPSAVDAARAYLKRFPNGRFHTQARRVLDENESSD